MSTETVLLEEKVSELLTWEKRKKHEQILVAVIFFSLAASVVALPLCSLLLPGVSPWLMPGGFFILLAPWHFFYRRWRTSDGARMSTDKAYVSAISPRLPRPWQNHRSSMM